MDDVTFGAGVWLLRTDEAAQLQQLMSAITDPDDRGRQARSFIREHVDPVELVRTAAAVRAGLLTISVPEFARHAGAGSSG